MQFRLAVLLGVVLAGVISVLIPIKAKAQLAGQNGSKPRLDSVQHVLLLSIDGMHGIDLANLVIDTEA